MAIGSYRYIDSGAFPRALSFKLQEWGEDVGRAAYSFFRYRILNALDEDVPRSKHVQIILDSAGHYVPHRKADPEPHEFDTFIMRAKRETILKHGCAVFDVARKITGRVEHRYIASADDLEMQFVSADDTHWTHAIMVPRYGVIAIKDGSANGLTADSGAGRIRSILRHIAGAEFEFEKTATPQDVSQAVTRLELTSFSFTARPFNPHPHIPGDQMDALLKAARINRLTAKAEPAYGGSMTAAEDGLISEAVGLANNGYGVYGFRGRTSSGAEVAYPKPTMKGTVEENLKQQAKNATLKVLVADDDEEKSEEEYVVETIVDLYSGG